MKIIFLLLILFTKIIDAAEVQEDPWFWGKIKYKINKEYTDRGNNLYFNKKQYIGFNYFFGKYYKCSWLCEDMNEDQKSRHTSEVIKTRNPTYYRPCYLNLALLGVIIYGGFRFYNYHPKGIW